MRFKVGDKVKVKSNLVACEYYSDIFCNGVMPAIGGEILTIDRVVISIPSFYEVKENGWIWADDMLEPVENNNTEENAIMKFKVGDKVKVRSDLIVGHAYYSADRTYYDTVAPAMKEYAGKIVTIDMVIETIGGYRIKEDADHWRWTDEMFESKEEEKKMNENNNTTVRCHCCGAEIEVTDSTPCFEGKYFCDEECYDNEVTHCDKCGELMWRDDSYTCEGDILCESCADEHTFICDHCEERFYTRDMVSDGNISLCEYCFSNRYYRCHNCGDIICEDDACWYDEDPYCESCYDDIRDNAPIHDYSYKPNPIFHGNGKRFFGVELEIDGAGEYDNNAEKLLDIANTDADHIYIKHDGSIDDGFEIVSHPMTLEYHKDKMPWNEVMKKAVSLDYRSHQTDTCGLHVHVNRSSFGETVDEQETNIAKVLFFIELHWNEIVKFTRRSTSKINEWASRYGYESNPKKLLDKAKGSRMRYAAVNLMNSNTIEFRVFRGTLKYNTFIATLQFVNKLCDIACDCDESMINDMSWLDFVGSIVEPELIQYLKERKLYINEEIETEEEV